MRRRLFALVLLGFTVALAQTPHTHEHRFSGAQREQLANLQPVRGKPADPQLPAPVDRVLVVDTYHHIGERVAYFGRLRERLKPGGAVAIVDFTRKSPVGPPRSARLAADVVGAEMQRAGYALAAQHDFLRDPSARSMPQIP